MRARAAVWFVVPLALASAGCSWSRFDDVVDGSPIVLLNRPKALEAGFGSSLASARVGDDVTLLVGGSPLTAGGAEFNLGTGDAPGQEARDTGHCLGSENPCYFSASPVALARAKGPAKQPQDLCFVDGAGTAAGDQGVVVRCSDERREYDDVEYALPVPAGAADLLEFSINFAQPTMFRFGADHDACRTESRCEKTEKGVEPAANPGLLATADEQTEVWYYPPLTRDEEQMVVLPNPADAKGRWTKDTERTLAIARVGAVGKLLVVGLPKESAVRLFYAADGFTPSYVGCIGGTPSFGRAFATGHVDGDDNDELVISDDSLVYVFDAGQLATLPPTDSPDCSLAALPEGSLITSFGCGSTKNITGCPESNFGSSLGVGDLDGDGDGEVVVGAPNMTVRHKGGAGAVLIYDVEDGKAGAPANLYDLKDIAFLSSAEEGDRLGSALNLADLGDHDLLVAGAPGGGKTALFYCPSFLPAELKGSRCQ